MTTNLCPVCEKPLSLDYFDELVLVYCPHGPCPSEASNCGATGPTPEEAREKLCRLVEQEREQNDHLSPCCGVEFDRDLRICPRCKENV